MESFFFPTGIFLRTCGESSSLETMIKMIRILSERQEEKLVESGEFVRTQCPSPSVRRLSAAAGAPLCLFFCVFACYCCGGWVAVLLLGDC